MDVPFSEVPSLASATIAAHPTSARDCLLATSEDGDRVAFAFEVDSDTPGLSFVDPSLWLAAAESGSPEHSRLRFEAFEGPADDWRQAIISHPVGAEWLGDIKQAHPEAYHEWFAQTQYDEGGEEGSG